MNCTESQDLLQQRLDGNPLAERVALDRHLADCPECRLLHAAATRLEDGLRLLTPPVPPSGLAANIAGRVAGERYRRLRLRRWMAIGAAAAVLLAIFLGFLRPGSSSESTWVTDKYHEALYALGMKQRPTPWITTGLLEIRLEEKRPDEPAPSLRASVVEAGSAVASLGRRTADETVGQTKLLLPEGIPVPPLATSEPMQLVIEPPTDSLRQAGQGMTAALDPVTSSARRAFSLFLREASAVTPVE